MTCYFMRFFVACLVLATSLTSAAFAQSAGEDTRYGISMRAGAEGGAALAHCMERLEIGFDDPRLCANSFLDACLRDPDGNDFEGCQWAQRDLWDVLLAKNVEMLQRMSSAFDDGVFDANDPRAMRGNFDREQEAWAAWRDAVCIADQRMWGWEKGSSSEIGCYQTMSVNRIAAIWENLRWMQSAN